MMSPSARLVYMANQIARNLAAQGTETAAQSLADHITSFWDPRMKARILAMFASGEADGLDPIALRAIRMLRERAVPSPPGAAEVAAAAGSDVSDAG